MYIQPPSLSTLSQCAPTKAAHLSTSIADSLGSRQHGRGTGQAAVGDDAAGGSEAQLIEFAAHARVVIGGATDLGDGGEDAGVLFVFNISNKTSFWT
jgi:hypothetical protein